MALRYLKAKRRQSVISVVTVISIIGVMAGVCALVVALAINNGFREEMEKSLLGATANINLLRSKNDGIKDYEALSARLGRLPHAFRLRKKPSFLCVVLVHPLKDFAQ